LPCNAIKVSGGFFFDSGHKEKDVITYLATVDVPILNPRGDVALAGNVDALRESLHHRRAVGLVLLVENGGDALELIGRGLVEAC